MNLPDQLGPGLRFLERAEAFFSWSMWTFFVSHRLPIAMTAMKEGYRVHLACAFTDQWDYLSSLGIELHPLPLSRSGTGAVKDL